MIQIQYFAGNSDLSLAVERESELEMEVLANADCADEADDKRVLSLIHI